jgi:heme-degrading monooxygenase HmoA
MTYIRMTRLQIDTSKVEDGIRFFREVAMPTARREPGFEGARLLVDRTAGTLISMLLWESEAAAQAAESAMGQTRRQGAQQLGVTTPTTEIFEMAVNESA